MLVAGMSFQPSLMFVGKARSLPYIGRPERCFTWVGSDITHEHNTTINISQGQTLQLTANINKLCPQKVLQHFALVATFYSLLLFFTDEAMISQIVLSRENTFQTCLIFVKYFSLNKLVCLLPQSFSCQSKIWL